MSASLHQISLPDPLTCGSPHYDCHILQMRSIIVRQWPGRLLLSPEINAQYLDYTQLVTKAENVTTTLVSDLGSMATTGDN